ncbi:uncharacterized protein LOC132177718 [Corylus avellana]|uniref:uncharacterized protein LOC132177718 n=1 Tax=Corylus avellana TaxID=13451 RepID=UPI00286B5D0A|nr:uncharacterized protein LOC132177718 [Corylus avellana]
MSEESDASTGCSYCVNFKMNNEDLVEDAFESFEIDDDVVELNSLEDDSISMGNRKKTKKRRKTSIVWQYYDIVPNIDPNDSEVWVKCKTCGNKYRARSSYGTGNLRKHSKVCGGRNTHDVGQMLLAGKAESLSFVNVRDKLRNLFMEYNASSITSSSSSIAVQRPQVPRVTQAWEKEYLAFCAVDVNSQKNQLEIYLEEPRSMDMDDSFDILSFWKGNEFRYPKVAAMARDVLSIPISTVASESTFSIDGRVIDQYKSSLKPDIVEALVCTKDWLYGDQELTQMKLDSKEDVLTTDVNFCDIPNSAGAQSINIF